MLAGYLFGALVLAFMLRDILSALPTTFLSVSIVQSSLTYVAGPACLLLLALERLWHIRRFYAINIAKLHQDDACGRDADGTLDAPTDHLAPHVQAIRLPLRTDCPALRAARVRRCPGPGHDRALEPEHAAGPVST
ncbi:hypothetical protein [Massilia genomosp. 1]|uniref:hypothetical protein n=1 Tax=Massilia genomosp. 1 TaxID=2609280 RepID=UPI001E2A7488|nr:hypothetical protein [Massilia genomosp. 1]